MADVCTSPGNVTGAALYENQFPSDKNVSSSPTYYLGAEVTYECDDGYRHDTGNLTRVCEGNNTWSGNPPICTTPNGDGGIDRQTVIISAACTFLAMMVFFIFFRIDFYYYQQKKARSRRFRTAGHINKGELRPTSYVVSTSKSVPFHFAALYKDADCNDPMQKSLNSDILNVLGVPPNHYKKNNDATLRKNKKTRSLRKSVNKERIYITDASVQTDLSLQHNDTGKLARTRSLPSGKKKKRKQKVAPFSDRMSQSLNLSNGHTSSLYPLQEQVLREDRLMPIANQYSNMHMGPTYNNIDIHEIPQDVMIQPVSDRGRALPLRSPQSQEPVGLNDAEGEYIGHINPSGSPSVSYIDER